MARTKRTGIKLLPTKASLTTKVKEEAVLEEKHEQVYQRTNKTGNLEKQEQPLPRYKDVIEYWELFLMLDYQWPCPTYVYGIKNEDKGCMSTEFELPPRNIPYEFPLVIPQNVVAFEVKFYTEVHKNKSGKMHQRPKTTGDETIRRYDNTDTYIKGLVGLSSCSLVTVIDGINHEGKGTFSTKVELETNWISSWFLLHALRDVNSFEVTFYMVEKSERSYEGEF